MNTDGALLVCQCGEIFIRKSNRQRYCSHDCRRPKRGYAAVAAANRSPEKAQKCGPGCTCKRHVSRPKPQHVKDAVAAANREREWTTAMRSKLSESSSVAQREYYDRMRAGYDSAGERAQRLGAGGLYRKYGEFLRWQDGDLCQLCLKRIDFNQTDIGLRPSVDHVIPKRLGGSDRLDNYWLAHRRCNSRKGARHIGRKDGTTDVRSTAA